MKSINLQLRKSKLFLQEERSNVKISILLTILTYIVLWIIGLILGRLLAICTLNGIEFIANFNESMKIALRKLIVCGTQITVFFLWVKFIEKRAINSIGFQTKRPLKTYIIGFIIGLGAITVITAILTLIGAIKLQYHPVGYGYIVIDIAIIALGWMIQSAFEEIATRGWLIPRLGSHCSPIMAITITAILFGILHLFSSGVTVLSFLNLTLSGIFFAGYAIYNENIWGVCGLHFSWNLTLGNIYGFPVSGYSANGKTLLQSQQIGSKLLTGGDFGPEGGLVTTILLLVGIVVLMVKGKKKYVNYI